MIKNVTKVGRVYFNHLKLIEAHHQSIKSDFRFCVKNFEQDMKLKQLQLDKNVCLLLLLLLLDNLLLIVPMTSHVFQLPLITFTLWLMIFTVAGKTPSVIIHRLRLFESSAHF